MQKDRSGLVWRTGLLCIVGEVRFHALRSAIRCLRLMPLIPAQDRYCLQAIVFTLAGFLTVLIGSVLNKGFLIPKKRVLERFLNYPCYRLSCSIFFFYVGLANTTGVKASIIEGVNVFVAVLVASLLFQQEKLTGKKNRRLSDRFCRSCHCQFRRQSMDMGFRLTGEGFIFLSTVAYAFSSVFLKRYSKDENPVLLSGYQFVTGGIIMCVIGLLMGGRVHGFAARSTGMLVYLAVVSAVAYSPVGESC